MAAFGKSQADSSAIDRDGDADLKGLKALLDLNSQISEAIHLFLCTAFRWRAGIRT